MSISTGRGSAAARISVIRKGRAMEPYEAPRVLTLISSPPPPVRLAISLANPVQDRLRDYVLANRATPGLAVASQNAFSGQTVAVCGAGPSLRETPISRVDQIWACNSGLPFLAQRGYRVDAAIGIDQTPGLLREWSDPPDVTYYIASSCDPALVAHLRAHNRRVVFFHNAVGIAESGDDEVAFYKKEWPTPMCMVGNGFTVVSRSLGLLRWLGFERVDVYGADCALGDDAAAHANGENALQAYGNPLLMQHTIGGRRWVTRPDMLMDAVHLARVARSAGGSVRLLGDTLPVALMGKDEAYLDRVSRVLRPGETPDDIPLNEAPSPE